MHVAQHKNVPDSEIEEKVSKAIYQFEKILKEHPELADRMFAKYAVKEALRYLFDKSIVVRAQAHALLRHTLVTWHDGKEVAQ